MSEDIKRKKTPLWVKILIILSTLPVVMLPGILGSCTAVRYEEIKVFVMIYPCYVIASAILAWISYRQRPEISIILIVLMLLSHVAMWALPGAI